MADKKTTPTKAIQVDFPLMRQRIVKAAYYLRLPVLLIVIAATAAGILNLDLARVDWDWNLLLRYISVLRWPVVALVAIFVLKNHIPTLIKKLKKAGWGDKYAEFASEQSTEPAPADEEALKIVTNEGALGTEKTTQSNRPAVQPPSDDEILQNPEVQLLFERIYRGIFGTQLEALKLLKSYPNGLSQNDLAALLETHKTLAPNPYTSVLTFMNYLASYGLIEKDVPNGYYKITYAGNLFLEYLSSQGIFSITKPY